MEFHTIGERKMLSANLCCVNNGEIPAPVGRKGTTESIRTAPTCSQRNVFVS